MAAALMRHMIRESEKAGRKGLILTCKDKLLSYYSKFGYKNLGVSASVHGGAVWYDMILEFDRWKITLVTVGKIKEKYLQQAISEYEKRLSRYCKLEILQVADEKTPEGASAALEEQIKEKEGERILAQIKEGAYVAALAIEGEMLDSVELSEKIDKLGVSGVSQIVFVIGGSLGLSQKVLKRADYKLSFSKMTFPHQLMRVILLEQIYRSYRIIHGCPYHK